MKAKNSQTRFSLFFDAAGDQCRLPLAGIWEKIVEHLRRFDCCPNMFSLSMNPEDGITDLKFEDLTSEGVRQHLASHKYGGFRVNTHKYQCKTFNISLGVHRHTPDPPELDIVADVRLRFPASWNALIETLAEVFPLRSACQYDFLYESWQGTGRLDQWKECWGPVPPYKQRVQKLAGIDTPLVWLDNFLNPGRSVTRDWKRQSVSAEMWLGPGFWLYAPCTKEELLAADFFLEKRDTPHYLYLKSWPHPFTRPDGEQGRVQQKLWRLLYKQDCEWPPGSGGISDVPVGGPPELMP
jgi:hypothetical protein